MQHFEFLHTFIIPPVARPYRADAHSHMFLKSCDPPNTEYLYPFVSIYLTKAIQMFEIQEDVASMARN
jgi:hypothetical protein